MPHKINCKFHNKCNKPNCYFIHPAECQSGFYCIGLCPLRHIGRIHKDCHYSDSCRKFGACPYIHYKEPIWYVNIKNAWCGVCGLKYFLNNIKLYNIKNYGKVYLCEHHNPTCVDDIIDLLEFNGMNCDESNM